VIFENNETKFIQVVYELNKDNCKREVEQLQEVQKKFNKK
jgi:hypothetical protein